MRGKYIPDYWTRKAWQSITGWPKACPICHGKEDGHFHVDPKTGKVLHQTRGPKVPW